ncbi:immune inhibitor A [Myxococcota bacterium]|nr:immune inhibitor A [Myxococcota bacterium]
MTPALALLLLPACAPKPVAPAPAAPLAPPVDPSAEMVAAIQRLDLSDLGNPVLRWDSEPPLATPADAPHTALVLLVEFSDVRFDRFAGQPDQGDQLAAFYQDMLFDASFARKDTLSHYYADQSDGRYHMDGVVLPPVRLDKPLAEYGRSYRPEGGTWRNDQDPDGLIVDAMAKVAARGDLDTSRLDRWDPRDFDQDGVTDEPDGYVDHLVIVYAGRGQNTCQRIRKLQEILNPNVGMDVLSTLSPAQTECSDRIWPHRDELRINDGQGPAVGQSVHENGGAPLAGGLWVRDYNMQCEYTSASTFIHEMGHSLGLPDVYAQTSNNSTGPWEVMSHTSDPSPQNLSAWSRLQLGWLKPQVIVPPAFGGAQEVTVHLADLGTAGPDASRAALVVLPPKQRRLELTTLPAQAGTTALYSGQGNDLDRKATIELAVPAEGASLEMDAWWEIEAGWDFAYLELSADQGRSWTRLSPTDPRHMPAKHGHDGPDSKPGLTGLSGDLDGDGKNESMTGCDPTAEIKSGEDRADGANNPCEDASWVSLAFDLSAWKGQPVRLRWRYFTDGAAVEDGLLVDNMRLGGAWSDDFEQGPGATWKLDGFTTSPGHHDLLVPHFYLLEYRDPTLASDRGYDGGMAEGSLSFYWDAQRKALGAMEVKPRPGMLAWYYDGAFAWSENDPAVNGAGHGYLLAVDSNPNEIAFPGAAAWLQGDPAAFDTRYVLDGPDTQSALKQALAQTVCFLREPAYVPEDLVTDGLYKLCKPKTAAPARKVAFGDRRLIFGSQYADLLPGDARSGLRPVGELLDFQVRDGVLSYRLNDRSLRAMHTLDNPFSPVATERGVVIYDLVKGALVEREVRPYPAVTTFDDSSTGRWQNPNLPFGGVALPQAGLRWEVQPPAADAPAGTRATVVLRWAEAAPTVAPAAAQ